MQGREIDFKDGKKRRIHFGVRAASMIEHEFGDQSFARILALGAGFRFVAYTIWAGLQKGNPGITYEETCELIDNYLQKTPEGAYSDLLAIAVDALIDAGIMVRATPKEATDPNAQKEAEPPAPSPNGGTSDAQQSSDTTG